MKKMRWKKFLRMFKSIYKKLPVIRELLQCKQELQSSRILITQLIGHCDVLSELAVASSPRFQDKKRLLSYGYQVSSQNQEDGMIHEILRRLRITMGVCVEIGVGNGHECNTAFLLTQGWKGFWIDSDPSFLETISQSVYKNHQITGRQAFATKENIGSIFHSMNIPREFELLSIDVDRNTYHILEGVSEYKPKILVVEYNAAVPPDTEWVINYSSKEVWDGTQNMGASLKAYEQLAKRLDYSLVGCDFTGVNAFFIRNDCLDPFRHLFREPFDSMTHYEPPRYRFLQRFSHPGKMLA
jgi:hypothetical protein